VSDSEQLRIPKRARWIEWIVDHFPPGQFGRYLIVGVGNTIFGYGTYAGLTAMLTGRVPFAYMVASILSSFLNITFSFLTYKWFIFKTKGNYLREWSRCVVVYGGTYALAVALLPVSVFLVRHFTSAAESAPYVAGALQMTLLATLGFLGHKTFSFAPKRERELAQSE
jgi:putative flippase GtrA